MTDAMLVKGCCPLDCQDTCAWVAHVVDGRVIRVEGAREHPFTRGSLCAKVNDYQERTYASDRLLHPLRRIGRKGSAEFARMSWDEALDEIATRFQTILERHGGEALLPVNYLGSMGVLQRRALMRLFHVLGSSRLHGSICGASGNALEAEGHPRGFDPEEIADSRFVLLWGANLLTTSHHHFHFIQEARRRHGARLVCVDPRRTVTAAACDQHISIRPGSDAVFAAGLAHVMFREDLADLDFARQAAADLDVLAEQVEPWTPAAVSDACGVAAQVVIDLAREFARAQPATIRCGVAPQQTTSGEAFVRSLSALAVLGGHWRHPGGGLFIETGPLFDETAALRPDLVPQPARSLDIARLGEHLTSTTLTPPVMGLMVWTMNPVVDQPDVSRVRRGLAREDLFTVVLEHFLTDTARYADVVLPSTTQLEHFDAQGAWGHHYVTANHPAVAPLGESKSHPEILRLLAARMGLSHPALFESDEEIVAACLPPGVSIASLRQHGWHKTVRERPDPRRTGRPLTLAGGGVPRPPSPPSADTLQLLTPKSHYFMNSSFANMPRQRRSMGRPTLEMHRSDAYRRRLCDEQEVIVSNGRGAIRAWLKVTADIHPGVVALPGKWWREPASGGAANELTPSSWSPGGQPAYNDTFVYVSPAPTAE